MRRPSRSTTSGRLRRAIVLVLGACASAAESSAGVPLPIPCATGACGATGPSRFVTAGSATAVVAQNTLTVKQTTAQAVLNWSSFDIGTGGSVVFQQPGANSIALNRIFQANPSQIFGNLTSNGQVYLINLNGFLFGKTATVNVGGLLVSSLPIALTDANFASGILSPLQNGSKAVFDAALDPQAPGTGRSSVLDLNGNVVLDASGRPMPVQVVVEAGAQVTAAPQGRLLLAGQTVTNGGSLSAPDGQVILAAGQKVYLQASTDPSLRGLVVEVDQGGTAWNQLTGQISTPRGNVTLVGLAVNQDGRISATTAVSENGSVRLEAADTATFGGGIGNTTVSSTHGGALTIGSTSQIEVLPELSSTATEVPSQPQLPSSVTLLGEQVVMQGGTITAPSGNLTAIAAANPSAGVAVDGNAAARLRIDAGTQIDLSGSEATLPVSANLVTAQLRANELADDPAQRNGPLRGQTVVIDARLGSPLIANLSGEIAAVPQSVAQRTETGGKAVFESEGDIVFAKGASIDVSGGKTNYLGGQMQTSYLVGANGQLYPIATASPLMTYVGVVNPTYAQSFDKWGVQEVVPTPGLSTYEPGYVQGAAAGSVQFAAPAMALGGRLLGTSVNGPYQRTPATTVAGGQLVLGLPGGLGNSASIGQVDYLAPSVQIVTTPVPVAVSDGATLPAGLPLQLSADYLTSSGFTSTRINSNTDVTLAAGVPLALPAGGSLAVRAARVDLLSGITASDGALSFSNVYTVGSGSATLGRPGVYVGDGVTIDVRGQWTNDSVAAGTPDLGSTWQNGGSIAMSLSAPGALLSIGDDVSLRASGGAWLQANGTIVPGTGGSIALNAGVVQGGLSVGRSVEIEGFGVNGATGGTFSLTAPRIEIDGASAPWADRQVVDDLSGTGPVLRVGAGLFSNFGFSTVKLQASGLVAPGAPTTNVLTLDDGVAIDAVAGSLVLEASAAQTRSSQNVAAISTSALLDPSLRPASTVSLSALPPATGAQPEHIGSTSVGDVSVGAGASITTDAGGTLSLTSLGSIVVAGTLRSPGGTVTLHVVSPSEGYDGYEEGYIPSQRIELTDTGAIDVAGTFVASPSAQGLSLGKVSNGGAVNLFADRGAVQTDPRSTISIAGTSATFDVLQADGRYLREDQATAAGAIRVQSGEAISLLGALHGAAGVGGSGPAAAGSLAVQLTRAESWWGVSSVAAAESFSQAPLTVALEPLAAGIGLSPANGNKAVIGVAELAQSGIDALELDAGQAIHLDTGVNLTLGRSLVLDAPAIAVTPSAQVNLAAPFVQLGYGAAVPNLAQASGGTGAVHVTGDNVVLLGSVVTQGAASVTLESRGDLQLRGVDSAGPAKGLIGSLSVAGDLTLEAARLYPSTATSYALDAVGPYATLAIAQTGASPGTPLSAAGALTFAGASITNAGSVYAPFGTISFDATKSVQLANGSITSVSGAGLTIPYGQTQFDGAQWVYQGGSGVQSVSGTPARAVSVNAPSVSLAPHATVDLSGGGDLLAYEWIPGTGGSKDALGAGVTPGLYAILPASAGQFAPFDAQEFTGTGLGAGASVYLSGGGGVAAGTYALLPARYALLPGAVLLQIQPQYQSASPGTIGALGNGAPVVAGYLTYGTTGLHASPDYTGFAIYPGSYGSQLATYAQSLASGYFTAPPAGGTTARPSRPADAGTLAIAVTAALDLEGQVRTSAATGGEAATIEISASDLVVGAPSASTPADAVSVSGAVLAGWQPGSLLLGGTVAAGSNTIDVQANSVTIAPGTSLAAGQIVVVAGKSIEVEGGATLESTSGATGQALAALPTAEPVKMTGAGGGGAALLSVSDLNWVVADRSGLPAGAAGGQVTIDAGASLASRGSISIDAPRGVAINGAIAGVGAAWSLGSSSIAIVPSGTTRDALAVDPGLLGQLGQAGEVRLASTGAIDLLTPVALGVGSNGRPTLNSLTLQAASINNLSGAGGGGPGATTTTFGAETVVLEGAAGTAPPGVTGPAGATLSIVAGEIDVGPNSVAINGFGTTRLAASGSIVGRGTGGIAVGGDLTLSSANVTVASDAQTTIASTGRLAVTTVAHGDGTPAPASLGGALTLSGASIDVGGTITAHSGIVNLVSPGSVTLSPGGSVSVAGTTVAIGNQALDSPGGWVDVAAGGNLVLATGTTIDVSGAGSAAAGLLQLSAGQTATLGATLAHGSSGTPAGGRFVVDAGAIASPGGASSNPLTALTSALAAAGFSDSVSVRVRNGDLTLAGGSTLAANSVALTADRGTVAIDGQIVAASGAMRGSVDIFGGSGVEVAPGAAIHADGTGAAGRGGDIEIGAGRLTDGPAVAYGAGASISLDAGSVITAKGAAGSGTLRLRAPALATPDGVAINAIGADVSGVGSLIVEPVLAISAGTFSNPSAPTAADFQGVYATVANFMGSSGAGIAGRLTPAGRAPVVVEPGVEIVAQGPLTLAADPNSFASPPVALDLSTWRFNGAPVDLTVRAVGDVTIANTISDGITQAQIGNSVQPALLGGPSSSIRVIAGADLSSANPLAVQAGAPGTLTIAPGAVVTTGTGFINLAASRDVVAAGSVFTTGAPAIAAGGSVADPYVAVSGAVGADVGYGIQVPRSEFLMSFPTGGGNVVVQAGRDVLATPLVDAGVPNWQLREGSRNGAIPAIWGVNLNAYDWTFGTLGGGDVRVEAGRDVTNALVAASGSLIGGTPTGAQALPSGGLAVSAGRDVGSAQVFLADGTGSVVARGGLTAILPSVTTGDANVGSGFYLQGSSLSVRAGKTIVLDGIFNPTALGQPGAIGSAGKYLGGAYYTLGDSSSLSVESVSGDVVFGTAASGIATLLGPAVGNANGISANTWPSSVNLVSLSGGVSFGYGVGQASLYPSASGQLRIIAAQSITTTGSAIIQMSDAPAGRLPTAADPTATGSIGGTNFAGDIHAGDVQPALVVAGVDINGLTLSLPKAARISAGEDIINLTYQGQNATPSDATIISAGRDFQYASSYAGAGVSVGGPGQLDLLAGRNVGLGFSIGIATTGNLLNPNLPTAQGADLTVATGLGTAPDVGGFVQKIVAPSKPYEAELVSYVESLQGSSGLTYATAAADFSTLSADMQRPFVDQVFFNELVTSGRASNQVGTAGFSQGFAAIDALFPGSRTASASSVPGSYAGDLTLAFSRIYTLSGGTITLVVPGGSINVGLANPPPFLASRPPSTLGIVAEGSGSVDIYSKGDVNVNASRIFTLGGGDILIWSDEGSIDAGRGAKSAVSAPPPAILISSSGTVTLDLSGAAAGSGIRTIQTDPEQPLGSVDLIAPLGTVNAGDAGIGAAGNINIAAQHVIGLDNIQFGGSSAGVPSAVSSLGASLSSVASAATSSTNAGTNGANSAEEREKAAAPLAQSALGWLDVFVTGLGEDACKPDDVDCLRRQKHD